MRTSKKNAAVPSTSIHHGRLIEDADFGTNNYLFRSIFILILAGMLTSKIVAFDAQKTPTHTLKSRRIQNESLFGEDFGLEA